MMKKAFSLVELMVVIAIIGILSAIAVPSYKTYIIKSKIASGIPILENAMNIAIQNYETTGSFSNPLSIYGTTISQGGWIALNFSPVIGLHYNYNSSNVWACIFFSDIGIPGFVANNQNSSGNNRLCMQARLTNDIWSKSCGIWGASDFSTQYLPGGCNCNNVSGMGC
jgi:type IV pilus assembly protein PilA